MLSMLCNAMNEVLLQLVMITTTTTFGLRNPSLTTQNR